MSIQLSDHFTYGRLLRFTFPTIVMMIFTSIYGVVDGIFVSNYAGKTAFAAINLILPYLMVFGTIGFMRADTAPELEVILCQPAEADKLPYSLGAKGCGELCMIPSAPACAHAYYRYDGKGTLSRAEIEALDAGAEFENGYKKVHP